MCKCLTVSDPRPRCPNPTRLWATNMPQDKLDNGGGGLLASPPRGKSPAGEGGCGKGMLPTRPADQPASQVGWVHPAPRGLRKGCCALEDWTGSSLRVGAWQPGSPNMGSRVVHKRDVGVRAARPGHSQDARRPIDKTTCTAVHGAQHERHAAQQTRPRQTPRTHNAAETSWKLDTSQCKPYKAV